MIRRRLVVAVVLTVAVAIGVGSFAMVSALERRLVDDVDDMFADGSLSLDVRRRLADERYRPSAGGDDRFEEARDVAIIQYDAAGDVIAALASGTRARPDPLPTGAWVEPSDGLVTVRSSEADGERYRAAALSTSDGGTVLVAASLAEVDAAVRELRRIQLVVGLVATAAAGLACWELIRRSFSPIDDMITVAGRIAGGDLEQRVDVRDTTSEVGRLGTSLDAMLDRIQTSVASVQESEATMRQFVADASHELRTPLTSVRGYAELFRHGADDPDEIRTAMRRIEDEATRMSGLVDELMTLARLDRRPTLDRRDTDLVALAAAAVDAAQTVDADRTYQLGSQRSVPAPVTASVDAGQIRQVIDNLLTNVRRHTPTGTTATVEVRHTAHDTRAGDTRAGGTQAGGLDIVVSDDGPGIGGPDRARVFDRFWRGTRADQAGTDGSGLGLSIVRAIVAAHGGAIALDAAPGGGARFSIHLPNPPVTTTHPKGTP